MRLFPYNSRRLFRGCIVVLLSTVMLTLQAQDGRHKVLFYINTIPGSHTAAPAVFLAGSFNGWNPKDNLYKFQADERGGYSLRVSFPNGSYEYKVTRGGWDRVECKKDGSGIENRRLKVEGDTRVELTVEEWQDLFSNAPKTSTASKQVRVIDTAFRIDPLNRTRRIWVYLPEEYTSSKTRYPVLYMHDGQNVFDATTSFAGEWGVDECLDSMRKKCIVVAIDNGGDKRMNEYAPYDFSLKGYDRSAPGKTHPGEGAAYVDFLAKNLKPFIDRNYRTRKDRKNTFIAGSSMGGLISMYALLRYPKLFGGAGVFSPSFWIAPKILEEVKAKGKKVKARIYFYAGKQEGEGMVPDMLKVFEAMLKLTSSAMTTVIRDEGKHNEPTWRREFPLFYEWIFSGK